MNSTTMLVCEPVEKEKRPRVSSSRGVSGLRHITFTTEYSTEPRACQIANAPTLEEIEREIAAAARQRIEAALRDLNDTRTRIERERAARETALQAAQERASKTRAEFDGLANERAALERRAETFLTGDALHATREKIHLAFNIRQLELEDALAVAEADVREMQTEIQAAQISDALELQLAEQYLAQLETAAPDVAEAVRLAATAQENLLAARQAVNDGLLNDAEVLLEKAKAGNAETTQVSEVEQMLADARKHQTVRDLIARLNAIDDAPGAVRRIKRLVAEAERAGVADQVLPVANRALETAHRAANARYAQARPIADHLVTEGFVPVLGDGRIEVWKPFSNRGARDARNGHGWTLDRVMILRNDVWETERPEVAVMRKDLAPHAKRSRWYHAWKNRVVVG
jgi:hypothetical protein